MVPNRVVNLTNAEERGAKTTVLQEKGGDANYLQLWAQALKARKAPFDTQT